MNHNFKELKIWKYAINVSKNVYTLTKDLPKSERFGLIDQMNRSSVSIASNIAEGSGRTSTKEFARFIDISISSSYELETQLILCKNIYQIESKSVTEELNELQKMLRGFKKILV
ncbi:MAG: four helix bundle protein [Fluviicola sp.]